MVWMVVGASGSCSQSEGCFMGDTFEEVCDDHACAICQGEVSDEFIAMVQQAAAQLGQVMTFDQAMVWLRDL
jgi:hypothetical protein